MGRSRGGSATCARHLAGLPWIGRGGRTPAAAHTTNARSWRTNVAFAPRARAATRHRRPQHDETFARRESRRVCARHAAPARYGVRARWLAAANTPLAYKLDTMRVHGNDTRHQHQGDVRRVADVGTRRGVLSRGDLPSDEPWCRVDRRE